MNPWIDFLLNVFLPGLLMTVAWFYWTGAIKNWWHLYRARRKE